MIMKKLLIFAISAMLIMAGCEKNGTDDNKPNKPDSEKPDDQDSDKLPKLPDPTDVCSGMDDIEFMKYCYDHFDINKDGKISEQEYNAVKEINCESSAISSFKGIEYFTNLETFLCRDNTKIKAIDLSHNRKITLISSYAFEGCTSLISVTIPDSVTKIGDGAFDSCTSLTSVTMPNGVTEIGISAFYGCNSLVSVTIPNSVRSINHGAFRECTSLSSVTIPERVLSIGEHAFQDCKRLRSIYCKPTNPPTLAYDNRYTSFTFTSACTIYVPQASINRYKSAQYWSNYAGQIQGYNF